MKTKLITLILAALLLPSIALAQPVIGAGGTGEYRGLILKERGTTLGECQSINLLTSLDGAKTGEACSITNLSRAYVLNSYMTCDLTSDHTAALRTLVETTAAGKTIFVPSGCKVLLGSPGAGDWVAEFPSNTTIECEDQTAGFVLARKSCSSGSDTPGAACTADNQCHNGTCDADYPSGTAFAPTEGSTYGVFGAAASSSFVGIRGCSIWVNNASGAPQAIGGNGKHYGYCDGAGGSDVTGEACVVTCDAASGILYGVPCTSSATCDTGTCTEYAGTCKTGGGACAAVPYGTNFSNAGPGKINVIDFSNASNATIDRVNIYDHRRGDQTVKTGLSGLVANLKADGRSLVVPAVDTWIGYTINASVTNGLVLGSGTSATSASATGWETGITADGYNTITNCTGAVLGDASQAGWTGGTGLSIKNAGCIVRGFTGYGGLNCIRPAFGLGYNFLVSNAYCDGQIGAKFIIGGSGNQYMGVRGAWAGRGAVVGLGDQRGVCTGGTGTRTGKVCVFGAGNDATIGCPTGGTCAANDAYPAGSAGHFLVGGGTLLHTDQANVDFFRTPDSKRCDSGTDAGGPCTTNGDCATGTCRSLQFTQGTIQDVKFYYGSGGTNTAINLNTSAIGVNHATANNGGGPSIADWTVNLDMSSGFGAGIKFPPMAKICVGGSNAGNSCTVAADCSSGGGTCEPPVKNFVAYGNVAGATTPITNWDWTYGDISGLKSLLTTDDQGVVINKVADGTIARGQLVKAATTADRVVALGTSEGPLVVGVALNDAQTGTSVKVMTSGQAQCITDSGTIALGDVLKASTSSGGRVATGSTAAGDVIVGIANATDGASASLFDCTIRPPAVQAVIAAPFITVRKASDTGRTVQTVTADPELTFATGSSKKYAVDGILMVSQTGATGDIAGGFDIPGTSTGTVNVWYFGGNAVSTPSQVTGDNSTGKLGEIPNGTTALWVQGTITTATSGTTSFVWAQSGGPNGTTTLLTGSYIRFMEIP